ncbi:MAG: TonB-dependent receptor [Acidobacteria bacterium]|nr:TonB-dependent receptor [Acidobacteriota bacterium]
MPAVSATIEWIKSKHGSAQKVFAGLAIALLVSFPCWGQVELKGRVLDATGASVPNASVTVYTGEQVAPQTQTKSTGEFSLSLSPGEYRLEVNAPNFEAYSEVLEVKTGMKSLAITLSLATFQQTLEVEEEPYMIALESERNPGTLVLDEDFLRDLPDDEEELAQILRDLAGPGSGGSGDAEFIIDGLSGQGPPPKDQIQEIRINSSPFSAEYSRPGRNRIEIITRPGTGQFRGNLGFGFRDESLNARQAGADLKPPYQQRNLRANFSGPLLQNRLSFSFFTMRSDRENSDTVQAILPDGPLLQAVVIPAENRRYDARLQYRLSGKHTLDSGIEYGSNHRENQGVGGFSLPERASESRSRDVEFQTRETAILSSNILHETRFQFTRGTSNTRPLTDAPAINVLDAFRSGGATNRREQTDYSYEFGNLLTYSGEALTTKTGLQANYQQSHNLSEENFRGTYVYSSLQEFLDGTPTTFSINTGNPILDFSQWELGLFLQNDWRVNRKLLLSSGVRYEAQTNIGDKNNFDPRLGFAYALNKSVTLRGGAGLFHQRLNTNTVESLLRLDGTRQIRTVVSSRSDPEPPPSIRTRAADLALPYTVNSSLALETRLPRGISLAATYEFVRGIHLYRSRNLNAPLQGETTPPDPSRGNIEQLESTGTSTQHALHLRYNQRIGPLTFFSNYSLSSSRNDMDGPFSLPANNYDLRAEWGRASNDQRHRFFAGLSTRLPWNISSNIRVQANSGPPFNITTGKDDNYDTETNDRPIGVSRNSGQGPGFFEIDLNLTKTISLKSSGGPSLSRNALPQQGGGWPGGGGPGGPGGGIGGGPPGGQRGRQSGPTLAVSFNINNLLNHTNFTRYSGVLTSPYFGKANSTRSPREIELGIRLNF